MQVVLVHLQGCPAAWLGAYGNEWVVTPNLDRIAAEGIVFDRHIAECPSPDPGATRLLDGIPSPLRADLDALDDDGFLERLRSEPSWLLVLDIDRLIPPWDVSQEVFEAYLAGEDVELDDQDAEDAVEPCADPPVGPFDPSDRAAWEWLHTSFAAVVTKLDAELGHAFDRLREAGLDRTATWVVTSDFGYPIGEHGQVGLHRPWLHEELVHLPLIVRVPESAQAGRRVPAYTQPADVRRTLAEGFGCASPDGHDLMPLTRGEHNGPRAAAITTLELGGAVEWAIRTADWAYLHPVQAAADDPPREPLLFAKPDDLREVNELRIRNIETAEELERTLREALRERSPAAAEPGAPPTQTAGL